MCSDPDDARAVIRPTGVVPSGDQPWSSLRKRPLRSRKRKRKWQKPKETHSSMGDQSGHFFPAATQTSPGAPPHLTVGPVADRL
jgi:hypothetical protein